MLLRMQRERMEEGVIPSLENYTKYYGMTIERYSKKPELILMHPGPVNYGIEMDYEVTGFPNCLIQTQVKYGVFIRMSVLSLLAAYVRHNQ